MKLKLNRFQTIFTVCLGLLAVTTFILNAHYDWNLFSIFPYDTLTKTYNQGACSSSWIIPADNDIVDFSKQFVSASFSLSNSNGITFCSGSCGASGQETTITIENKKLPAEGYWGSFCGIGDGFGVSSSDMIFTDKNLHFTVNGGSTKNVNLKVVYIPYRASLLKYFERMHLIYSCCSL